MPFCQAGYIYRPVRERSPRQILKLHEQGLAATGHDEASFLSLSAGDYTLLNPLMKAFMDTHEDRHVALSLPSLRVKSLNTEMMRQSSGSARPASLCPGGRHPEAEGRHQQGSD